MRAWDLFLLFHAAGVVLDATERWQRLSLVVLAPDLANHRNLTLYVNALLLVVWAGASLRGRRWEGFDDERIAGAWPSSTSSPASTSSTATSSSSPR